MRSVLPAVCCVLLLVLAGCSVGYSGPQGADAPPATPETTATPTPTETSVDTGTPTRTPTDSATGTREGPATPTPSPTPPAPAATPVPTPTPQPDSGSASGNGSPGGDAGGPLGGLLGDGDERDDRRDITVEGGDLPLDPDRVYRRTGRLLGTDAPGPETIQLLDTTANTTSPPEFQRLLGLERNVTEAEAIAFVAGPRVVFVNRDLADRRDFLEHVLAHEYTHTVQFQRGHIGRVTAATGSHPDGRFASTAVIEGAATYTEDRYWLSYMLGDTTRARPGRSAERRYRESDGAARYSFAPYWFGYRYVNATVDGPADLPAVYADPPVTGEQVLHPGVEEGPVPLRVELRGETTGTWQETFAPQRGRMGEAFLRVALATELGDERAARAAAGWGNDTRIAFNNETGARGYAWVLRFDDAANATEFDAAVADYLDERTGSRPLVDDRTGRQWTTTLDGRPVAYRLRTVDDRTGRQWTTTLDGRPVAYRLRTVDDRTTVLLLGTPAFVDADTTTVRGTDGRVVLATDGAGER